MNMLVGISISLHLNEYSLQKKKGKNDMFQVGSSILFEMQKSNLYLYEFRGMPHVSLGLFEDLLLFTLAMGIYNMIWRLFKDFLDGKHRRLIIS